MSMPSATAAAAAAAASVGLHNNYQNNHQNISLQHHNSNSNHLTGFQSLSNVSTISNQHAIVACAAAAAAAVSGIENCPSISCASSAIQSLYDTTTIAKKECNLLGISG